tara:strand:- start:1767 stop:3251 length:1485 start_codon:yes stop_codon:yes gene_type:complete
MADATPQLKRKRESLAGLQTKPKKQRKSEATAGQDVGTDEQVVAATPIDEAPSQSPAAPKAQERPKGRSRKPKTNGVHESAVASTPSSAKQHRKQAGSHPNGDLDTEDAEVASIDTPLKQSKKERKEDRKKTEQHPGKESDNQVDDLSAQGTSARSGSTSQAVEKLSKKQANKERKSLAKVTENIQSGRSQLSKPKKQKNKNTAAWSISPAQGGWFLPIEPIFSLDEKYLILANPKYLQIYSTETSLLASVLPMGSTGFVTAYALSSTKPHQVYVADSNGLITLWDWVDGTKIGRWDIGATVRNMAVITQPGSDEDLVYCHEAGSSHIVNVHALRTKSQASKTELKRVLKTTSAITSIQVLLQGRYVVIATPESIMVGKRVRVSKTAVQDFEYIWRELKFSKRITTCNSYLRQSEASDKAKKTAKDQRDILDVAVGDEIGVVLLFEDILAGFAMIELSQKGSTGSTESAESLRPKLLHWHRDAVGSVKWSLDGK